MSKGDKLCGDLMEPDVAALSYVACDRRVYTKNGKHGGKHRYMFPSGALAQWWGPMPVGRQAEGAKEVFDG